VTSGVTVFMRKWKNDREKQGGHKPGKPGILRDFSEHGKLREFCATSGKNCNKQSIFSLSFKCLSKTAFDWVNRIIKISGSSDPVQ